MPRCASIAWPVRSRRGRPRLNRRSRSRTPPPAAPAPLGPPRRNGFAPGCPSPARPPSGRPGEQHRHLRSCGRIAGDVAGELAAVRHPHRGVPRRLCGLKGWERLSGRQSRISPSIQPSALGLIRPWQQHSPAIGNARRQPEFPVVECPHPCHSMPHVQTDPGFIFWTLAPALHREDEVGRVAFPRDSDRSGKVRRGGARLSPSRFHRRRCVAGQDESPRRKMGVPTAAPRGQRGLARGNREPGPQPRLLTLRSCSPTISSWNCGTSGRPFPG